MYKGDFSSDICKSIRLDQHVLIIFDIYKTKE